jgi:hypothetical protein
VTVFRRRPGLVEAVQWTGENIAEVAAFLAEDVRCRWRPIETATGVLDISGMSFRLNDWIVHDEDGWLENFQADEFAATFEPADDVEAEAECPTDLREQLVQASRDVISLAEVAGMPDSYVQTDSRMRRARDVLDNLADDVEASHAD